MIPLFILLLSTVFQLAEKRNPSTGPNSPIAWTAGFSHDDKYIAVGDDRGSVHIYETAHWTLVKSWQHEETTITKIEWNPKYPLLAVTGISRKKGQSVAQVFDVEKKETVKMLPDTIQGRALSWKPDGEQAAFGTAKGYIGIYSKTGGHVKTLSYCNPRGLFDMDWHPTFNWLLAVEENIYIIDANKDVLAANFNDGSDNKGILSAQWHPSGQYFATGDYGHESEGGEPSFLKIWDVSGKLQSTSANSRSEYRNLRWSNDGNYLAAAGDNLLVFDKKSKLKKIKLGKDNIWGVGWNSTNDKIITTDQAGNVRIIDVNGKVIRHITL